MTQSTVRRWFALLAVVALLVLGGCLGGGGGDTDDGGGAQDLELYADDGGADEVTDDGGGETEGNESGQAAASTDGDDGETNVDLSDVVNDSDSGTTDGSDGTTDDETGSVDATTDDGLSRRNITWVEVVRPRTTETVQLEYPNETYRDVRLAGIEAPSNEQVDEDHSFVKIGNDSSALDCLAIEADEAWKYLHNQGSNEYRVVRDDEVDGVHLVERDGVATLNERLLGNGYAQYGGSGQYVDRYTEAQSDAREEQTNIWFCAPPGTEW